MDCSLICVVIVLFACLQQGYAGCSCCCGGLRNRVRRLEDAVEKIEASQDSECSGEESEEGTHNVVLRAISGSGRHVLNDWLDDAYTCPDTGFTNCSRVYKNKKLMKRWNEFSKARIQMYEGDNVVAWLLFNIEGTTPKTFWDKNKLEKSSWTDLPKTDNQYEAFTMDYGGRVPYRDFYIVNNFLGCPNDKMWIMVRNPSESPAICEFDGVTEETPYFLYSKKTTMGQFDTDKSSMGIADRFEISLEE